MLNSIEDQKNVNKILIRVAKHLNIDFIITNDAHYISPEGAKAQEISLMLGSKDDGKQVTMKDKTKFGIMRKIIDSICNNEISIKEIENILENNDEVQRYNLNTEKSKLITAIEIKDVMLGNRKLPKIWGFSTTDFWFKNYTEMIEIWKSQHEYLSKEDFEKGLENTIKVSNLVEKFDLDLSAKLPVVDTGNKNQYEYLVELAKIGWKKKIKGIIKDEKIYKKRLMTELKVINILDISGYLIIVADYINWAKNNNILVGCGRGSSAGSLVCYLLNITEIDPIQHKLLFERFISVARSMALYNFKLENINEEKLSLNFNKSEILKWKNKKKILMVI
ncbi:MAG: hypothetical protein WC934_13160 [Acidithiobacillus sp.]|jgi:DNA polymerase III alpha subunit|uniref:hypothetical protein n=1 Tax=Acidithiobacillus sp. TaxID=1872118 RepID=UPI00355E3D02